MNVLRLNDKVMSDAVFSNTPAIDGGEKGAQLWFGRKCHVIYAEKIKTTADYLRTLQNFVREYGAPDAIICDHANNQSSGRVLDYLRMLWIRLWVSEAHYQHQNAF